MDTVKMKPLKSLRIALEMSLKEFAKTFECTPAYITVIEKDDRVMKRQTLGYVLNKLTITLNQYDELDGFY